MLTIINDLQVPGVHLTILEKNDDVVSKFYVLHKRSLTVYVRVEHGTRTFILELGLLCSDSTR